MERTKCRFLCGLSGRSYPLERNFVPSREGCRGSRSKAAQKFRVVCGGFCAKREKVSTGYYASDGFVLINMYRVYLKTKKMTNISQAQAGFKAKSRRNPLWISRLFHARSSCVCRNRLNFRLFRYTLYIFISTNPSDA